MTPETEALLALYGRNLTRDADIAWYANAKQIARTRAKSAHIDYPTYAAVVAATSPATQWDAPGKGTWPNLDSADRAIRHWRHEAWEGEPYPGMLGVSLAKASAILDGADPADVLGPKTVAFWHALMGDLEHVVLDRWALRAIGQRDSTPREPKYSELAAHYHQAATIAGVSPAQLQAATWTQIRREWKDAR